MRKVKWGVLGVAKIAVEKVDSRHAARRGLGNRGDRLARHRESAGGRGAARHSASPMAPMRRCWPIRRSRRSTIHCRTSCTSPGRSRRSRRASMCFARSRSGSVRTKRRRSSKRATGRAGWSPRPSWSAFIRNGAARANLSQSGEIGAAQCDPDLLLLSAARSGECPQSTAGRRRPLRHRLLRSADRPLHFRRGAGPCGGDARPRPEFRHRPARERGPGIPRRPASDLQRRDAALGPSARHDRGRERPDRGSDSVQCAARPPDPDPDRFRRRSCSGAGRASRNSRFAINTRCRATPFPVRFWAKRRSNFRSRTPCSTCA